MDSNKQGQIIAIFINDVRRKIYIEVGLRARGITSLPTLRYASQSRSCHWLSNELSVRTASFVLRWDHFGSPYSLTQTEIPFLMASHMIIPQNYINIIYLYLQHSFTVAS